MVDVTTYAYQRSLDQENTKLRNAVNEDYAIVSRISGYKVNVYRRELARWLGRRWMELGDSFKIGYHPETKHWFKLMGNGTWVRLDEVEESGLEYQRAKDKYFYALHEELRETFKIVGDNKNNLGRRLPKLSETETQAWARQLRRYYTVNDILAPFVD